MPIVYGLSFNKQVVKDLPMKPPASLCNKLPSIPTTRTVENMSGLTKSQVPSPKSQVPSQYPSLQYPEKQDTEFLS